MLEVPFEIMFWKKEKSSMKEPTNKDELQTRFGTHNHLSSNSDALTTELLEAFIGKQEP